MFDTKGKILMELVGKKLHAKNKKNYGTGSTNFDKQKLKIVLNSLTHKEGIF